MCVVCVSVYVCSVCMCVRTMYVCLLYVNLCVHMLACVYGVVSVQMYCYAIGVNKSTLQLHMRRLMRQLMRRVTRPLMPSADCVS